MFKDSIATMGIQAPIVCVREGSVYWLVDGLHRLQEAKLQDMRSVPVVCVEGTMKDVLLKNLVMNRLRGKVRASQMVQVIEELREKHGMSLDDIAKTSGLSMRHLERLVSIGQAGGPVWDALDKEQLSVAQAYEISRVPKEDSRERLVKMAIMYDIPAKDLRDICEDTIKLLREREAKEAEAPEKPVKEIPPSLIKCHFCEEDRPIERVKGFNICYYCFGIAYSEIKKRLAEVEEKAKREEELAREAAGVE